MDASLVKAGAQGSPLIEMFGKPFEQILNVLVYFMPVNKDRNDVSGTHPQIFFVISDLLSLHRTMLTRRPEAMPVATDGLNVDGKRLVYAASAYTLRTLRALQVLLEMRLHRAFGSENALQFCFALEVVKLVLKYISKGTTPFAIHVDEEAVDEVEDCHMAVAKRTADNWMPTKPLSNKDCSVSSMGVSIGETLYHLRPLIHLFLVMQLGRKSWKAWFTALGMDYASMYILGNSLGPKNHTRAFLTEGAEMQRRRNRLWWAVCRSPLFDELISKPLEDLDAFCQSTPLLSLFRFPELFLSLQPFWFSTSAS